MEWFRACTTQRQWTSSMKNNSNLLMHLDKRDTHVISSILHTVFKIFMATQYVAGSSVRLQLAQKSIQISNVFFALCRKRYYCPRDQYYCPLLQVPALFKRALKTIGSSLAPSFFTFVRKPISLIIN